MVWFDAIAARVRHLDRTLRGLPSDSRRAAVAVFVLALVVGSLGAVRDARATEDPAGHWEGAISLPNIELGVRVDLSRDGDRWTGTIDVPMQGATGIRLDPVEVDGSEIRFTMAGVPGDPTFHGQIDNGEIHGQFTQSGQAFPFRLGRDAATRQHRPQEPRPPFPYREEEVVIPSGREVRLAGTLTLPEGRGPFPAVALLSGSGPQDRDEEIFDHRPFLVIADHLSRAGIAVLRTDDRGVGGSTGTLTTATSEDLAEDARAMLAFLRDRRDIDRKRTGLLGHSEGAYVASLAAAKPRGPDFLVLLAGPGVPGHEIIARQTELILRQAGLEEEALSTILSEQRVLLDLTMSGADSARIVEQAARMVRAQFEGTRSGEPVDPEIVDRQARSSAMQIMSPWFRHFLSADPKEPLERIRVPVLALNGELDLQVDPAQNLTAIEQALTKARNRDVTVERLPGLNHLFQQAETGGVHEYAGIDETVNPAVLDRVRDWILERFGGRRR